MRCLRRCCELEGPASVPFPSPRQLSPMGVLRTLGVVACLAMAQAQGQVSQVRDLRARGARECLPTPMQRRRDAAAPVPKHRCSRVPLFYSTVRADARRAAASAAGALRGNTPRAAPGCRPRSRYPARAARLCRFEPSCTMNRGGRVPPQPRGAAGQPSLTVRTLPFFSPPDF